MKWSMDDVIEEEHIIAPLSSYQQLSRGPAKQNIAVVEGTLLAFCSITLFIATYPLHLFLCCSGHFDLLIFNHSLLYHFKFEM